MNLAAKALNKTCILYHKYFRGGDLPHTILVGNTVTCLIVCSLHCEIEIQG